MKLCKEITLNYPFGVTPPRHDCIVPLNLCLTLFECYPYPYSVAEISTSVGSILQSSWYRKSWIAQAFICLTLLSTGFLVFMNYLNITHGCPVWPIRPWPDFISEKSICSIHANGHFGFKKVIPRQTP